MDDFNDNISYSFNYSFVYDEDWPYNYTYIWICTPVIAFCVFAIAVNLVILSSYFWIKKPVSRTLQISFSLVVSDLCTFILDSMSLTINSLLPVGFGMRDPVLSLCSLLLLEALRIGGKLTTLGHLLVLAGIHYQSIRKPLEYLSRKTCSNTCKITVALWTVPTMSLILYFSALKDDGFSVPGCAAKFMRTYDFRSKLSAVFFCSVIFMSIIYLMIYRLVKRHQKIRNAFRRAGSQYSKTRHQDSREERDCGRERNEKALYTTLLIVGSTVVGWLPASITFYLVCDDCSFTHYKSDEWMIAINAFSNILLISKTALNSYIYAARMNGIRTAIRKMWLNIKKSCCHKGMNDLNQMDSRLTHSSRTSTVRSQMTIRCRLQSLLRRQSNNSTHL